MHGHDHSLVDESVIHRIRAARDKPILEIRFWSSDGQRGGNLDTGLEGSRSSTVTAVNTEVIRPSIGNRLTTEVIVIPHDQLQYSIHYVAKHEQQMPRKARVSILGQLQFFMSCVSTQ